MARGLGGTEIPEKDKKKITKQGLSNALKIFKFTVPYKGTYFLGFIFLLLSQITSMSIPILMGQMVGAVVGNKNETTTSLNPMMGSNMALEKLKNIFHQSPNFTLNEVAIIFAGLLILQALFSFGRVLTFARVSEQSIRDLRQQLYAKIITLPIPFFEQNRKGDIMSRISVDVNQVQGILSTTLAEFFRQIFTLLGGILFIFYISTKLTLFMLATFPFLVVAAMVFGRYIRKNSTIVQQELAKTNVIVSETLQSINAVKTFTNEKLEAIRYNTSTQTVMKHALKAATLRGGFISFVIFVLFGGIMAVVWYGGRMVLHNELAFKDLFTFMVFTGFIGGSVGGLGDLYSQIQQTIGASERILEILGDKSEVDLSNPLLTTFTKTPHKSSTIIYQNVGFHYPSRPEMEILKDISFTVKAGEKIALVGQSGAGKSTIVQLLMKFYNIQRGEISIDGQDIAEQDVTELRKKIAIVPQDVILFGGTIYENILYGNPKATKEEVIQAAKKANAFDFIDTFPEKLETVVGERGVKLSGGQRQRIAIARAILKDPAILILDEATSSLDAESEKLVQDALNDLMQNRTTIIIAHRLATIRSVDCIYVMKDGEIVETGTHQALSLKEEGIYANLVKLQFTEQVVASVEE